MAQVTNPVDRDTDPGATSAGSNQASTGSRRRRRLLLIVVALAVLGGLAYRRLGHIDSRLVGRWINAERDALPAECTFTADGSSSWVVAYISVPLRTGYGWCVRGNELVLANQQPFRLRPTLTSLRVNLGLLIGRLRDDGVVERLRILEVTDTTLKLKRETPWGSSRDGVEVYVRQKEE